MIEIRDIETLVASFIAEHEGFFLVKAEVKGANRIEVEVDHDSDPVDIDTIVALTKHIEAGLDREKEDFELEVSSAGLTTPLVGVRRYRKFIGKELEVLLKKGVKEKGVLVSADEEGFVLEVIRMEKHEGDKRRKGYPTTLRLSYEEVKSVVYDLKM